MKNTTMQQGAMIDNNVHHIQAVSQKYIALFNVLIVITPIANLLYWVFLNHLPSGFLADLPVMPTRDLTTFQLGLALLVSLLPMAVAMYGLVTLRGLFRLYTHAIIFSTENVRYFRRLGYAFIAWVIATTLFTPLISMVITFANSAGERALVAKFGIADIFTLVIAGIIMVIAWVMNEGRRLEDEQAYTV